MRSTRPATIHLLTVSCQRHCHSCCCPHFVFQCLDILADDQRATEIFIRDLATSVSNIVLIVISKFDREAQTAIRASYELLASQGKVDEISRQLIIVHNYRHVKTSLEALTEIQNLKRVHLYNDAVGNSKQQSLQIDPIYDSEEMSEPLDKKVPECWYLTRKFRHVLLFNDGATSDDTDYKLAKPWGEAYNTRVLDGLRGLIRHNVRLDATPNFFDSCEKFVNAELPRYLKFYDTRYVAQYEQAQIEAAAVGPLPVPQGAAAPVTALVLKPQPVGGALERKFAFDQKPVSFLDNGRCIFEQEAILKVRNSNFDAVPPQHASRSMRYL